MARSRLRAKFQGRPTRKSKHIEDEEISEDEAFNEEEEAKYGRFFQSKRGKPSEDKGELWESLFENVEDTHVDDSAVGSAATAKSESAQTEVAPRPTADSEYAFTRLEEDADLFTEDVSKEDVGGFDWIADAADGDSKYSSLIQKFREIRDDLPDVFREESRAKASRDERKELYSSTKKTASKRWEPVLQHIKRQKHTSYGGSESRTDATCGSMLQLDAETELEKELDAHTNQAYERALHARELRKNKRVNRIKSKNWHKRQKKRDLELYAKLIEKSDDPELTKELLESFEQKRSKHRVLRKRMAQEKWAKLAMRFGDRSVLKQISSAQQQLKDDLTLIKDTIDGVADREGSDSDDESEGSESSSDVESTSGDPDDEVLAKLKVIANPKAEGLPQKGLFALKFMKDVLQSKMEAQDDDDGSGSHQAVALRDKEEDDYDNESIESDSDREEEVGQTARESDAVKPSPKVSDEELKKAMQHIHMALGGGDESGDEETGFWGAVSSATTSAPAEDKEPVRQDARNEPKSSRAEKVEVGVKRESASSGAVESQAPVEPKVDHAKPKIVPAAAGFLSEDTGLDNFIKNLGPAKKRESTIQMAQRLFVTRGDDEAQLSEEESETEEAASDQLKGWGSWTGFGITEPKASKPAPAKPDKKGRRVVKVSNKKSAKLGKYLLHRVPHPHKNKHDYNAKMATTVGPEWNTSKMHAELIQPKTTIAVGSVVKPISAEGAKEYVKRMGKVLQRNRTRARL
ncbi:U3 SMALL NUCLEOLAR RNA-ASSOCIATED PROTEIN, putative [Babesia bigemina]|uniref:U3 SMALL NUCLEOLAR RNA-ASSOCIATED PROTEIN, putative n=1 Tax=Babesia bigemina TaxID=5866 RepID=A0A061D1S1_BABBI|nr:U3 SMALL NUCLEOLAR RNA-ASSOCIATED PROTEIN, putative [Babesia bigemina]CDR94593.1 U3 SMALL NUCLEOLAR RNA-ASSOCIATED PROTEIN, putative [Babesia bigemina]|eukprot:XP_012766779.1 U3 SMALL NUCLEOLAR RNA-ASSOCIATED PROTEIN, putative [Babesia bigemina]